MDNKMDGPAASDHSDSDSGDSWILLEHNSNCGESVPYFPENSAKREEEIETDKDEDTDGISIITDSEPETSAPCEQLNYENGSPDDDRPTVAENKLFFSEISHTTNSHDPQESIRCEEDLLGDSNGKMKTYVHKRNKKLSTILNIIVLGSVITAAGVALGHIWGVRDDCAIHSQSSVNKILSNLYKLQEENAYLRNKIKEITLASNFQLQQRKFDNEKPLAFKQKCRKVFEESLTNKNIGKTTKCVDNDNSLKYIDTVQPAFEQEFLSDLNKLKLFYQRNRSWLDTTIAKRLKDEEMYVKNNKHLKTNKINNEKKGHNEKLTEDIVSPTKFENFDIIPNDKKNTDNDKFDNNDNINKKVSYADSLKIEKTENVKNVKREVKEYTTDPTLKNKKQNKKKSVPLIDYLSENDSSDHTILKDNRYTGNKQKQDRKKHDRHKSHKKQKSKNKYERWQMKGGYMNDYDDISILSQDADVKNDINRNKVKEDIEHASETIDKNKESDSNKEKDTGKTEQNNYDIKDANWYEKRAIYRTEARKKLEKEMFGEGIPHSASWYTRRMQSREQCRAKPDNSTCKKSNINMKYKMLKMGKKISSRGF